MNFTEEIARRRTFGIISHPDAGKTTLTEKLLLFGGAILEAGAVKSHKIKKSATSDFMEIEKQRGISVATSVLAFNYQGIKILKGHLIGLVDDVGNINMRYHQINPNDIRFCSPPKKFLTASSERLIV